MPAQQHGSPTLAATHCPVGGNNPTRDMATAKTAE